MKLTPDQLAALVKTAIDNINARRAAQANAPTDEITIEEITAELETLIASAPNGEGNGEGTGEGEGNGGENDGIGGIAPDVVAQIALAVMKTIAPAPVAEPEPSAANPEPAPVAEPAPVVIDPPKSAAPVQQTKSATPPQQRKYANVFLGGNANRGGTDIKSRLAALGPQERRRTVYGLFGRAVKCIHAGKGDSEHAAFIAERKFSDAEMAQEFKALSATVPSDGGYLIPEVYANEIIEMLYPTTVISSLGARRLGMPNGNMNIPKMKSGVRATFIGENRKPSKSAPKFGNLKLSVKKLTALIPMSNDLLRSTNFDNDVIVGQDITRQMALGVDYGAFMGTGDEFQPLGILVNKSIAKIDTTAIDAMYAADGVLTPAFPNYLVGAVLKNNAYATSLGFVFNTSVEQYFKSMRDNAGSFIFAEEMNKNNTLAGYPYKSTNLLETANGRTSIVFGNWNDLIIGEQGALEITTSQDGSWTDDSGQLISAFENDQTLIRAIDHVDIGVRHDESFAVATKVAVPAY